MNPISPLPAEILALLSRDKTTLRSIVDAEGKEYRVPDDLQPRVLKSLSQQAERTRKNAEVFTPAWICCQMNNFCDEEWFDGPCPFNTLEGEKWKVKPEPVPFRTRCGWQKYIYSPRLEITCGEAPFLVSRYDAATGRVIPLRDRIGILDRKLRVVGENTQTEEEWFRWAKNAFKSVYGFELQADNLLIARINLLLTFVDYLAFRWNRLATLEELKEIAEILCWNLWQMDGLDGSVPFVFEEIIKKEQSGFDWWEEQKPPTIRLKTPCKVRDWRQKFITEFMPFSMSGGKKMKFDFVIGNPPYQETTDSDSSRMPPIYNLFMDAAFNIADCVELITPARFLFNAGYTPKAWNEKMLHDEHFKVLFYEPQSDKIFSNTEIKGGIVITYRDVRRSFGEIGVFTKYPELNEIVKKTSAKSQEFMDSIAYPPLSYGLTELVAKDFPEALDRLRTSAFTKLAEIFFEEIPDDNHCYISIYGLLNGKRVKRFVRSDYIRDKSGIIDKWTLLMPEASGIGSFGEKTATGIIAPPGAAFLQTFVGLGAFESEEETISLSKYIKTKFLRSLLGIFKITQHCGPNVWRMIPLQDFTSTSDIDWTVSVSAIDAQLYQKYGLSPEEIAFIETNVKAME